MGFASTSFRLRLLRIDAMAAREPKNADLNAGGYDDIDCRIVAVLQAEGRLSTADVARKVNLSPPAVADRIKRLLRAKIITGIHAVVDPAKIGYPIAALVRIRPSTSQLQRIPELARDIPEVVECHRVTGDDCFVMKLHLRAMDQLEPILDRFLIYGQTTTSIIHSTPAEPRPLPLETRRAAAVENGAARG